MNTTKIALLAGAAIVVAGGLIWAIKSNSTPSVDGRGTIGAPVATVTELNPFSHVASIPANVDPATIRFEKLRLVDVASKASLTAQDCKDKQFRDPDGSGCGSSAVAERVKALEARYSYAGPAVASGESAPGRDSFSVYFRPEEIAVDGPADKLKRDQAASLFQLTTSRSTIQQTVVDKQNSQFCEGSYVDGAWVRKDPKCQDQVKYISQSAPSPNLTVQVDLRHPGTMASH